MHNKRVSFYDLKKQEEKYYTENSYLLNTNIVIK